MLYPTSGASSTYDFLVVVHGYEPRSADVARRVGGSADRKIALAYDAPGLFAFDENGRLLRSMGFTLLPAELSSVQLIAAEIRGAAADRHVEVGIDISSMSRALLAPLLIALENVSESVSFAVDFWYMPPMFDASVHPTAAIETAELLHPRFAGLAADPLKPVAAIVGVGYEPNLGLGVSEYLDVASVYAFVPFGHDTQFDQATEEANRSLFLGETPCRRAEYDLTDPYDLYVRLESLMYGLARTNRVAVVPLGPKIFSLCSILAAMQSDSPAAIWRFSSGQAAAAPHRSGGEPIKLRVVTTGGSRRPPDNGATAGL